MSLKTTLEVYGDTYLDRYYPDVNRSSATSKEYNKYTGATLLQFDTDLKFAYSKIITAKLHIPMDMTLIDTSIHYFCPAYTEYIANSITYNNCNDNLKLEGAYDYVDSNASYSDGYYTTDITDKLQARKESKWFNVSFPSGELNGKTVYYRESGKISFIEIEYENPTVLTPELINLDGNYYTKDDKITLQWLFNSNGGAPQKNVEIAFRNNANANWQREVYLPDYKDNSYVIDAKYLSDYGVEGKVVAGLKITNTQNKTTERSKLVEFTIMTAPNAPIVQQIENDCRPYVYWNSVDQNEYEVEITNQFGEYIESCNMTTGYAVRKYQMKSFLKPGTYIARVRIKNAYGYMSEYGESVFDIIYESKTAPKFMLERKNGTIICRVEALNGLGIVYRADGEKYNAVGIVIDGIFIDYNVKSETEYTYFIRDYYGGYIDSAEKSITADYDGINIRSVENMEKCICCYKNTDENDIINHSIQNNISLQYYAGRELPVVESDGSVSKEYEVSCVIEKEEYNALLEVGKSGKKVLVTSRDYAFYGIIKSIGIKRIFDDTLYMISLSISEIDYSEEVI